MNLYFDSYAEKAHATAYEIVSIADFFNWSGETSVEWILGKSKCEIDLLEALFSSA